MYGRIGILLKNPLQLNSGNTEYTLCLLYIRHVMLIVFNIILELVDFRNGQNISLIFFIWGQMSEKLGTVSLETM